MVETNRTNVPSRRSIEELRARTYTFDEVRNAVGTALIETGNLKGAGTNWTLDVKLEGLDTDRTFTSYEEALDFVLPSFVVWPMGQILEKAAA